MNIKDKRIKEEINSIIKASLVKGYVPTSDEVISLLGQNIISKNLGAPIFSFSPIYKDFGIDKLNGAKQATAKDLAIIFSCMVELYNETEKQINKFEVEKEQHNYRASQLELELTNLVNKYAAEGYSDSVAENMVDMQSFDSKETSCDVDIYNNEATLKKLYDIPITNINEIKAVFNNQKVSTNGSIADFIGKKGSVWQGIVSKTQQDKTTLEVSIDLGEVTDVNKLELVMPLLKPAGIKAEVSTDYSRWNKVAEETIATKLVVSVGTSCRFIRLTFDKTEADKYIEGEYQYFFIIDTISMFKINYAMESQIVTKPIRFAKNVNKTYLMENASIPTSTSIEYYVSLNKPQPEWVEIRPMNSSDGDGGNLVTFNTINNGKVLDIKMPEGISNEALELKHLSVNGQRIYSIAELQGVSLSQCKLYKGTNAWRVDNINVSQPGAADKSLFIGNRYTPSTSYKPLPFGKPSLIMNSDRFTNPAVLRYSTMVNCPVSKVLKAPIMANFPVTIYLNGVVIYKGKPDGYTSLTYSFRQGKNILEVVVNVNSLNQTTFALASVDLNLDIQSISSFICAEPESLKQVSLFNLRYNTNNQKDVFAIRKTNSGYAVVIKDGDPKIDYRLIYDEILEEIDELLLKIVMKREYGAVNITPRLKGYELRVV